MSIDNNDPETTHNKSNRWPEPVTPAPDDEAIGFWICDGVTEATDGCAVEPDGVCPHGHPSWLLRMGTV